MRVLPHINENGISGEIADTEEYMAKKPSTPIKPTKPSRTGPKPLDGGSGQPKPPQ